MAEKENLNNKNAVDKMREIVDNNHTALLLTNLKNLPISTRPMYTQKVDEEGIFWFLSTDEGEHNSHIEADSNVQLMYANESDSEYLSVFGTASLSKNKDQIEEFWSPMAKAWFDDKDDPRISVIKVTPKESAYWDTKHNKLVSLLKIAGSVISDKKMDDGISGKMKV